MHPKGKAIKDVIYQPINLHYFALTINYKQNISKN